MEFSHNSVFTNVPHSFPKFIQTHEKRHYITQRIQRNKVLYTANITTIKTTTAVDLFATSHSHVMGESRSIYLSFNLREPCLS